jgi:hypothetical protein
VDPVKKGQKQLGRTAQKTIGGMPFELTLKVRKTFVFSEARLISQNNVFKVDGEALLSPAKVWEVKV